MKVAVIPTIRDYPWGAPGHCMGELVRGLHSAGHQVLWCVAPVDLNRPEVGELAGRGVIVEPLPPPPRTYIRFGGLRRAWERVSSARPGLDQLIGRFAPDHVFINQGGTWCALREEFSGLLSTRPYSLLCHLNQPQPPFAAAEFVRARALMAQARRVYVNSAWVRRLAENQIARPIPQARLFQCPVRFDFAQPLAWPLNPAPVLAMVNRLDTHHKGIDVALHALARLRDAGQPVQLRLVGRGPDEAYLRELVAHLKLGPLVEFTGYTENLADLWRYAEMLLLPSRFEGLAVSMLEAMGFGRPVLRTPYGGAEEWIEDGVNGFICPAAETDLLVSTLARALSVRSDWPEFGRRAHHRIRRQLSADPARVFLESLDQKSS